MTTLNVGGSALVYSTCLGGAGDTPLGGDRGQGIAVDGQGRAYVTGYTASTSFPLAGPLPPPNHALQGNQDVFVTKLAEPTPTPAPSPTLAPCPSAGRVSVQTAQASGGRLRVSVSAQGAGNALLRLVFAGPDPPQIPNPNARIEDMARAMQTLVPGLTLPATAAPYTSTCTARRSARPRPSRSAIRQLSHAAASARGLGAELNLVTSAPGDGPARALAPVQSPGALSGAAIWLAIGTTHYILRLGTIQHRHPGHSACSQQPVAACAAVL